LALAFALVIVGCTSEKAAPRGDGKVPPLTKQALDFPRYGDLAAFDGAPWANRLQDEEDGKVPPDQRKYVTERDGVRTSLPAPTCSCRSATLWWVGGSAAYGIGQRDDHTIPSELVRLAEADGISLDVKNIAHPGWTIRNEQDAVEARLARGEPAPDVIAYFDGYNDVTFEVMTIALHGPTDASVKALTFEEVERYMTDTPGLEQHGGPARAGRDAARKYLRTKREAERTAEDHDAATLFVLQPDSFDSRRQLADTAEVGGVSIDSYLQSDIAAALRAAEPLVADEVLNLRHLFDRTADPVMVSVVHQNEEGARLTAEAIYPKLLPKL
jgi:hypothetical protein